MPYLYEQLKSPARLYIKMCPHCGLKYFGKTVKRDIVSYMGSGKHWKGHLKKHGVKPIHMWNSKWYYDTSITRFSLKFSRINHIVESAKWANQVEEDGVGYSPKLTPEQYKQISIKTTGISRPWSKQTRKSYNDKIKNGEIVNPHLKRWRVIDPMGNIHILDGLGSFCKDHNISQGNLSRGKTKGYTAVCLGRVSEISDIG